MGTKSKNAEGETRSTRTEQVGVAQNPNHSIGEGGFRGASKSNGDLSIGTAGTVGAKADSLVTGGILEQLIQDAEDQLQTSIECIEWYERERDKHLRRLNKLKELRELKQESDESEQPE